MITITLQPSEYALASYVSSVRQFVNKGFGVTDRQMGKDDGFRIVVDGYVAELAVCKHFNVFPDISFEPRKGGHDCLINGKRVDVKSTKPGRTKVFMPEWKAADEIDRYIYCYVEFRTVQIIGWYSHDDVFRTDNKEQSPQEGVMHHVLLFENIRKFR